MSITVLGRWQAREGEESAFLATAVHALEGAYEVRRLQRARVLQGMADPHAFVLMGDWANRESFLARVAPTGGDKRLLELSSSPPERYFFERLAFLEDMTYPGTVLGCTLIGAPEESKDQVQDFLLGEALTFQRNTPGFVLRTVYRDLDRPGQFLILRAWTSAGAAQDNLSHDIPALDSRLHQWGASVEQFLTRSRAELGRVYGGTLDSRPTPHPPGR